jgi:hypothetical protein
MLDDGGLILLRFLAEAAGAVRGALTAFEATEHPGRSPGDDQKGHHGQQEDGEQGAHLLARGRHGHHPPGWPRPC